MKLISQIGRGPPNDGNFKTNCVFSSVSLALTNIPERRKKLFVVKNNKKGFSFLLFVVSVTSFMFFARSRVF